MQFFHIPNLTICLSKKILCLYFIGFFCPAWDSFSFENILYVINWLFKLGEWNNRHPIRYFLKFIFSCKFTFKAYAKKVRKKTSALEKLLRLY